MRLRTAGIAMATALAVLYMKAALVQKQGKDNGEVLREADAVGVSEERVPDWFQEEQDCGSCARL